MIWVMDPKDDGPSALQDPESSSNHPHCICFGGLLGVITREELLLGASSYISTSLPTLRTP